MPFSSCAKISGRRFSETTKHERAADERCEGEPKDDPFAEAVCDRAAGEPEHNHEDGGRRYDEAEVGEAEPEIEHERGTSSMSMLMPNPYEKPLK